MKRLLLMLMLLLALFPLALADPAPLPGYTLRDAAGEVKVYATPSMKANIVGYIIPGGRQEVDVLQATGDWCYVRFTSIYGDTYGYIPIGCFDVAPAATPAPTLPPSYQPGTTATIRSAQPGSRLNLRSWPAASSSSLGKYYAGVAVTLTGQVQNGFAQVDVHGAAGWMDLRYLDTSSSVLIETPTVTVNNPGGGANLRQGPGTSYPRIGWYAHGTSLTLLGVTRGDWYHVQIGGQVGYLSSTLLSQTYPFDFGADSDSPASSDLATSTTTLYINTRNANSQLHLRKAASASAKSVGTFYNGTAVQVLSYTRTGWAYVRIHQVEGYMDATYLTAAAPTQVGRRCLVDNPYGTGLNLRALPNAGSELLSFLPDYTAVTVLGTLSDGWCCVSFGDLTGYVLASGLSGATP